MDKTELTERWHEVCYFLHQSISPSISEELFEQKVFQVLEKMGWSSFRKEIQPKQSIQVGSNNWIIPDITVKSQEKNFQFVVEVKKPSANIEDSSHKNQLFSYMRMLKIEFGLLIGSNIKIYYDGLLSDSEVPVLLSQFQFDESSEDGIRFINLFSKDTYSENQLTQFTEEMFVKLQAKKDYKKILNIITSEEYVGKLRQLIGNDLKEVYNDQAIIKALENISIKIVSNHDDSPIRNSSFQKETTSPQHYQKKGVIYEFRPSNEVEFKRLLLKNKFAYIKIFYNNGKTTSHDWNAKYFTEDSDLRGNINSKTWFRINYVIREGVNKAIFSIEPIQ